MLGDVAPITSNQAISIPPSAELDVPKETTICHSITQTQGIKADACWTQNPKAFPLVWASKINK